MFWNKKQTFTSDTPAIPTKGVATLTKPEEAPKVKLPAPKQVPAAVETYLSTQRKMEVDLIRTLKATVRGRPESNKAFDVRIFDPGETDASDIKIQNYASLDEHPQFILYEGWFDEKSKKVEMEEKNKGNFDVPLFTEAEIRQKIEALSEPGSSVFFYQARGPAAGGPLSRGAAVIELNPGPKGKKYIIYTDNVVGMNPVGRKQKLYDSDKPKEIAKWVKDAHHKRMSHYG
jgi:hypothetical protein